MDAQTFGLAQMPVESTNVQFSTKPAFCQTCVIRGFLFTILKLNNMLQGKLKEKFEQWYFKNYCSSSLKFSELMPHHKQDVFGWFYEQKTAMQKGVIIEFLDSIGIECFYQIGINIKDGSRDGFDYSIYVKNQVQYSGFGKTRLEAFSNSLETICKLYEDGRF